MTSGNMHKTWPQIGVLKYMGYQVGENGETVSTRHNVLQLVYEAPLPNIGPPDHMAEWGEPNSARRLNKIAWSIAIFCLNAKRKSVHLETAISDWETDLAWLKATYYDGNFAFRWPDTYL